MQVDFSALNMNERPMLILQTLDDTPVGVLYNANDLFADFCYNEISKISFSIPFGSEHYEHIKGMRIIDLRGCGRFLLFDPEEDDNGVEKIKVCTGYSLEYEFTFKTLTLENGTYRFWNPANPSDASTIMGIILEKMPSWSIGSVDSKLNSRYRTFDISGENIYNVMKQKLQDAYSCIFDFDTYNRRINVVEVSTAAKVNPVYLSLDNLVKQQTIQENSEGIVTKLYVTGADGVDIRSVNPMGVNYLINLDYFMTTENFPQSTINKYNSWKQTFQANQRPYYDLTVEEALRTQQLAAKQAELTTLQGELTSLENIQAVIIQGIAQGLKTQADLNDVNTSIATKRQQISAKQIEISNVELSLNNVSSRMSAINLSTSLSAFFSSSELNVLERYMKEDSVAEESFVYADVGSFNTSGESANLNSTSFSITGGEIVKVISNSGRTLYSITGGILACNSSSIVLSANIKTASFDVINGDMAFSASLGSGVITSGGGTQSPFPSGCVTISGLCSSITDDTIVAPDIGGGYYSGTRLTFVTSSAMFYFTQNVTAYQQRSVEWELFDYGQEIMSRVAFPSYEFTVDSANFLSAQGFEEFKNQIKLGEKIYSRYTGKDGTEGILQPIIVRCRIDFEKLNSLQFEFSSTFLSNSNEFTYAAFLDQSISAGKTLNSSQFSYNAFIDSGASTAIKDIMEESLDIAKNAIISSAEQAISIDDAGIRLRQWRDSSHTGYADEQIWMNQNSIMFTNNAWQTAVMGVGKFRDSNLGIQYGIVAPAIRGTILAGESLWIESARKSNDVAVFKIDSDGCKLYNSQFDLINKYTTNNVSYTGQISLNPSFGFLAGNVNSANSIYVFNGQGNITGVKASKPNSADIGVQNISALPTGYQPVSNFWVDMYGNVYLKGTIYATSGEFSGSLKGATGTFAGAVQGGSLNIGDRGNGSYYFTVDSQGNLNINNGAFSVTNTGVLTARSGTFSGTLSYPKVSGSITPATDNDNDGWITGCGINVNNGTFYVDKSGNVTMNGNLVLKSGSISWGALSSDVQNTVNNAQNTANGAYSYADSAYDRANDAYRQTGYISDDISNIVNGNYGGGSFISRNTISSPTIVGANIYWGDGGVWGSLTRSYGSDGISRTDLVELYSNEGIVLYASTGMRFEAESLWMNLNAYDVHVYYNGGYKNLVELIQEVAGA